jgi:hypothetical protein
MLNDVSNDFSIVQLASPQLLSISGAEKPTSAGKFSIYLMHSITSVRLHSFLGVFRLPQNTVLARKIREVTGKVADPLDSCQLCSTFGVNVSVCIISIAKTYREPRS